MFLPPPATRCLCGPGTMVQTQNSFFSCWGCRDGCSTELTRTTGSFGCEGHNRWSFCVLSNQQLQWRNQPIQSSCLPPSAGAPPLNSSVVSSERSNYNSTWTAMQNPLSKKQHREKKKNPPIFKLLSTSWDLQCLDSEGPERPVIP